MPRVKRGVVRRQKRKKLSKLTKGYFQNKSKLYKFMKEASEKAGVYAYTGRKRKKRDYRSLWIVRINAAARTILPVPVFLNRLAAPLCVFNFCFFAISIPSLPARAFQPWPSVSACPSCRSGSCASGCPPDEAWFPPPRPLRGP